ncbi:PH domain-containing protein [Shewanella sp. YLB-07]|uniref:PH domain-containing protein n=1 Tax=Shewanella sp. YLB-07 TaxID=2601268 RepID=UPI00128C0DBB|nr:PH domain-containing protein [Shewanella sp. YLB-07]MPY23071.1 PH domain-containing protein [Shewanella sp. YLB-07]
MDNSTDSANATNEATDNASGNAFGTLQTSERVADEISPQEHELPRQTQAESDWLSFDQIPLTPVDPRHYTQVLCETIIATLVLFSVLSVFIIFVAEFPIQVALPVLSVLGLAFSVITWLRYAHAKSIAFAVCDHELLMQKGIIWFKRISLPYTRLQHISLSQGPLERKLGLHTLKCFSAGSGSAEIELPGLESRTAEKLRQHLLAKAGIASQSGNPGPSINHSFDTSPKTSLKTSPDTSPDTHPERQESKPASLTTESER